MSELDSPRTVIATVASTRRRLGRAIILHQLFNLCGAIGLLVAVGHGQGLLVAAAAAAGLAVGIHRVRRADPILRAFAKTIPTSLVNSCLSHYPPWVEQAVTLLGLLTLPVEFFFNGVISPHRHRALERHVGLNVRLRQDGCLFVYDDASVGLPVIAAIDGFDHDAGQFVDPELATDDGLAEATRVLQEPV